MDKTFQLMDNITIMIRRFWTMSYKKKPDLHNKSGYSFYMSRDINTSV